MGIGEAGGEIIGAFIDLTGKTFGRLTVVQRHGKNKNGAILWKCNCNCNNKNIVVVGNNLRTNKTQSCGCLRNERIFVACKKFNKYDLTGSVGIGIIENHKKFAFDIEDYEKIKNHYWVISKNGYIVSQTISLHRFILNLRDYDGNDVDHRDGNKKNNQKSNLRICTTSQNAMNQQKRSNNTSGVTGVSFYPKYNKWVAYITINQKRKTLGYFEDLFDAVRVRKAAENEYFKDFSYDNSRRFDDVYEFAQS